MPDAESRRDVADTARTDADHGREVADEARVAADADRVTGEAVAILDLSESTRDMVDVVIQIGTEMRDMDRRRTAEVAAFAVGFRRLRWLTRLAVLALVLLIGMAWWNHSLATSNKANAALLVDCVTPGQHVPTADDQSTGHPCWDRLHDPRATGDAVAVIVDDLYCDQRRAQHHLPAVPDPTKPCRFQTDPAIYPGPPPMP